MSRLVVLDSEGITALHDPRHRRHRDVVALVQVIAHRKRRADAIEAAVPTSVRVESGWDRRSASWSFLNGLRIADAALDATLASAAASIRVTTAISVADAHIGALIQASSAAKITVVTSDPADVRSAAGETPVTLVAL